MRWGWTHAGRGVAAAAAMLAAALALSGCSDAPAEGADEAEAATATPRAGVTLDPSGHGSSRAERADVRVAVTGDLEFTWEETVDDLRIAILTPPDRPDLHLFSVGLENNHEVADEHEIFRWAVDIIGGYDGAGTYEINPVVPGEGVAGGGARSLTFLVFVRLIDPDAEERLAEENVETAFRFETPRQKCTLEVTDDEASGALSCPEVEAADGSTIALEVAWELLPAA